MRTLIFATTYVATSERKELTHHWLYLHQNLNPDCDLLVVDSASPISVLPLAIVYNAAFFSFPSSIGHTPGGVRAFCQGLSFAIANEYDYVVHIEGDSLLRLPVLPIIQQMQDEVINVASVLFFPNWVETGLMFFNTDFLRKSRFLSNYSWHSLPEAPELMLFKLLGSNLKIMPWKVLRDDESLATQENILSLNLDWISHCKDPKVYELFVNAALRR